MKLGIALIILSITFVDSSRYTNNTKVIKRIDNGTDITTSGERRWMTMFPKKTQKFVVTMKSIIARNDSNTYIKPSRKIPVFKIIPRVMKIRNENYWKRATTRQPLMKFIKFTMNPMTTLKVTTNSGDMEKETARKYKSYVFNKMMGASKKDDSSEQQGFAKDVNRSNDKSKHMNTFMSAFQNIRSRMHNNLKNSELVSKLGTDGKLDTSSEFSSEERDDKEEFIFVKPKKVEENSVKAIEDSSESEEITTVVFEHETKKRHKRRTNVIEEENLGTTVSGFKFTGKVASLSSDLIFRNINT